MTLTNQELETRRISDDLSLLNCMLKDQEAGPEEIAPPDHWLRAEAGVTQDIKRQGLEGFRQRASFSHMAGTDVC